MVLHVFFSVSPGRTFWSIISFFYNSSLPWHLQKLFRSSTRQRFTFLLIYLLSAFTIYASYFISQIFMMQKDLQHTKKELYSISTFYHMSYWKAWQFIDYSICVYLAYWIFHLSFLYHNYVPQDLMFYLHFLHYIPYVLFIIIKVRYLVKSYENLGEILLENIMIQLSNLRKTILLCMCVYILY